MIPEKHDKMTRKGTKLRDSKLRDENEKHEVLAEGPWEY